MDGASVASNAPEMAVTVLTRRPPRAPALRPRVPPPPRLRGVAPFEGGAENPIARLAHERHRQALAGRHARDLAGPERQAADLARELHHHGAHQRAAHPRPEA